MRFLQRLTVAALFFAIGLGLMQPAQTTGQDSRRTSDSPVTPPAFRGEQVFRVGHVQEKKSKEFKRGAKASPRHKLFSTPQHKAIKDTPAQYVNIPTYLSMWGNDQYGDCTCAETMFARVASSGGKLNPTDQEAIDFATAAGALNGAVITDVLDFEKATGTTIGGMVYKS